jgi:CubicO group peptidase (beta-lactamase class C family)
MRFSACIALAALFAAFTAAGDARAGWNEQTQAGAEAYIARFMRPSGKPQTASALSVAIGVDGAMVWGRGLGEEAPGRPATVNTVYRIGSITKQFTAGAILRLQELNAMGGAGSSVLRLARPVADYIDGVDGWTAKGQLPVTVRSLLNMTSNLPNFTRRPPEGLDPWGTVASGDLLAALKAFKPRGWPGSFEYSNTSYFILSEVAGHLRLPDGRETGGLHGFLRSELFARAGLTETGFAGDRDLEVRLPLAAYTRKPVFSSPDWLRGSADMLSSAADLYRWNAALLGGRVISSASLSEMLREAGRVTPTTYYGMGWFIAPQGAWTHYSHTGSVAGYTSCNAIARSNDGQRWISVTLLSNSDGVEGLEQLADDILSLIERD